MSIRIFLDETSPYYKKEIDNLQLKHYKTLVKHYKGLIKASRKAYFVERYPVSSHLELLDTAYGAISNALPEKYRDNVRYRQPLNDITQEIRDIENTRKEFMSDIMSHVFDLDDKSFSVEFIIWYNKDVHTELRLGIIDHRLPSMEDIGNLLSSIVDILGMKEDNDGVYDVGTRYNQPGNAIFYISRNHKPREGVGVVKPLVEKVEALLSEFEIKHRLTETD